MNFPRLTLSRPCALLALLVGAVMGCAEPATPAPSPEAKTNPVFPATHPVPAHLPPLTAGTEFRTVPGPTTPPLPPVEESDTTGPRHESALAPPLTSAPPSSAHFEPSPNLTANATTPVVQDPMAPAPMDPAAPAARTPGPAAKDGGRPTRPVRAAPGANEGREGIIGLLNLGQNLSERSDWDTAEITYRQVMASPNANTNDLADALIGLARVYRRQGSLTKAAAVYERFLNDYPDSQHRPDAYLELGRTHRALGAYQMALARFYSVINSTLKLSSEGFGHYQLLAKTAQFEIAETHFQQGNFAEANKFFSRLRLLDLSPADRAHAHFKSAYALYLGADMEGAVTTLNAYLGQWPEDENVAEARYLLSLSLGALGRKQEALDATLQLLSTQQATGDAKRWSYWQRKTGNQLANDFFQNGDTNNALVIYLGLVALSADPSWQLPITYQVGLCYERMRLTDRAIAAYQGIVDHAAPPATATSPSGQTGGPNPKLSPEQGKPVSSDLMELARMAAWRIGQLNWHDQTERQLAGIFIATPQPTKPAPLPVKASPVSSESAVPRLNL